MAPYSPTAHQFERNMSDADDATGCGRETIAIIGGTGAMGQALARRWARAGYSVIIGSRDAGRAVAVAAELDAQGHGLRISGCENRQAVAGAGVVVLTVPYAHHSEIVTQILPELSGKLFVDTTVPLRPPDITSAVQPKAGSAAQEAAHLIGDRADVVAAFQNVAAHLLRSDTDPGCDVLVSGDSPDARQRVIELAAAAGLVGWHAGPLCNAVAAEALTPVLLHINRHHRVRSAGIRIAARRAPDTEEYAPDSLQLIALRGLPSVQAGDNLPALVTAALRANNIILGRNDVLVVAQKIVSKAEGRLVNLADVRPSARARELAAETGKDERLVQLILDESVGIVRSKRGLLIVEHRCGMVLANAGIDQSNVPAGHALLLPENADRSAEELRRALIAATGVHPAVIVSDSSGRAWRKGVVGHALGVAGLEPLVDMRGRPDMLGRPLQATEVAVADSIAAAAALAMGEASEEKPVVLVRGYPRISDHVGIAPLIRGVGEDLFR